MPNRDTARSTHTRESWRRHAVEENIIIPLEEIVTAIACTIAYDHREHSCTGVTGRRTACVQPASFYHPVSVDLINGDDPGGGIRMKNVADPIVGISVDALDSGTIEIIDPVRICRDSFIPR